MNTLTICLHPHDKIHYKKNGYARCLDCGTPNRADANVDPFKHLVPTVIEPVEDHLCDGGRCSFCIRYYEDMGLDIDRLMALKGV